MFGGGVVVTELHKRRAMLLALDVGRYRVKMGRKKGRTEEGVQSGAAVESV